MSDDSPKEGSWKAIVFTALPFAGVLLAFAIIAFAGKPDPAQVGRFVVAHAQVDRVVVLDTVTGQLSVTGERDLKRLSESSSLKGKDKKGRQGSGEKPNDWDFDKKQKEDFEKKDK